MAATITTLPHWMTGATLALCLVVSVAAVAMRQQSTRAESQVRFNLHVERLEAAIVKRINQPNYGLNGLRAQYAAHEHISRPEFARTVGARILATEFPGVRGFGFIERVLRSDLDAFVAREQADSAPEFSVKSKGSLPDLYVIKLIEPVAKNRAAVGLDLGAEPVRREAVERAIETGLPTMSGRITLVQDQRQGPGFLYLLALYQHGSNPQTPEARRAALVGLVYTPIAVAELMQGVADAADNEIDFELFDNGMAAGTSGAELPAPQAATHTKVTHSNTATLLYDHDGHLGKNLRDVVTKDFADRSFSTVRNLTLGGRELTLRASTTPTFRMAGGLFGQLGLGVGIGSFFISLLLTSVVWLLSVGRERATLSAERMTVDLRAATATAEAAMRDSEALLRTLHTHSLVSITDPNGTIREVNNAFCEASGYSREELVGQNHRLFSSGTHSPFFWIDLWQTITEGRSWEGEICNRAKDGSLYWVDSVITPFFNAQGEIEKYISIRTDITAIKAAQEDLRKKDERLELALEGGNDGLWDWVNVNSHDEWWSPQFYRLLGYEPGEIESSLVAFDEMLHPDDRARTFNALEYAMSSEQIYEDLLDNRRGFDLEYRLRTKSGEYRWFHARAKVFFNEFGEATRMAGSIQDIHDRWLAQKQTQERSEQLDAIFSLSPDGFISFDIQGHITYASPAALRITGLVLGDLVGEDEAGLIKRITANAANPALLSSLDGLRNSRRDADLFGNHEDDAGGESTRNAVSLELLRPMHCTVELSLHQGDGSSSISQVMHLRDVTFQTEVDQMKSEFLSTAAHELRTPMASIYGFTELLMTREMPPEKQKMLLAKIYRQSQVMITILNELLDLARIEARRGKDFSLEATDLCQLLLDGVRDFQPPQERPSPELVMPNAPQWVNIDRNKFAQALRNLLSNAYKYSPGGGPVHARIVHRESAESGATQVGLQIEDHGLGLTPEQLARVCERFYRADKSGTILGTGLGMSIVKEIVELLGGQMELASVYGSGTTVTLWLPLQMAGAERLEAIALA